MSGNSNNSSKAHVMPSYQPPPPHHNHHHQPQQALTQTKLLSVVSPHITSLIKKHQQQQQLLQTRPHRPSTAPVQLSQRVQQAPPATRKKTNNTSRVQQQICKQQQQPPPQQQQQRATTTPNPKQLNIVLPPRRFSSLSSSCLAESGSRKSVNVEEEEEEEARVCRDAVTVGNLHFSSAYSPHKDYWIKNALQKLGTAWLRDEKITEGELLSPKFEEKMGILYDIAMASKQHSIDKLVREVEEEVNMTKSSGRSSNKKGRSKRRRSNQNEDSSVSDKFPFTSHVSDGVKRTMSSLLLGIMKGDGGCVLVLDEEVEEDKSALALKSKKSKPNDDVKGGGGGEEIATCATGKDSLNSFGSLGGSSLIRCSVVDGKLILGRDASSRTAGNQFWNTSRSRVRRQDAVGSSVQYFRKSANMMGFQAEDISIQYCTKSHRLVVSGSRPQRSVNENAREVREIVQLARSVRVADIVVMRTTKGSLVFEERDTENRT